MDQAEFLMGLIRDAVIEVFTQGDVVAFAHPNHRYDRRYIGDNELKISVEVGPKVGRVHVHCIQEIKHRSLINIDPLDVRDAINAVIARRTGGRILNAVFVSRQVHQSAKPLEEYVDKDSTDWRNNPGRVGGVWKYTLQSTEDLLGWNILETQQNVIGTMSYHSQERPVAPQSSSSSRKRTTRTAAPRGPATSFSRNG